MHVSFEKLKFSYNQTWVKDITGVLSYIDKVTGYTPRLRVIIGQVKWNMLAFVIWVFLES